MAVDRFIGVLESPLENAAPFLGERLPLRGWALAPAGIRRISARCGARAACDLPLGLTRPDLMTALSACPEAASTGFAGRLDVSHLPPGDHRLTVTAYGREAVLHEWRRTVRIGDAGTTYRDWRRARLAAAAADLEAASAPAEPPPAIAWLVRTGPATPAAATAATLASIDASFDRAQCEARVEVRVVDAAPSNLRQACSGLASPYVGVLTAGDRLAPSATALLRARLAAEPGLDLVYADHDHRDAHDRPADPVLMPGWSPRLGAHPDFAGGAWVMRRALLEDDAGEPPVDDARGPAGWPAAAIARCARVAHLPLPLVSLRRPAAPPAPPRVGGAAGPGTPRASAIVPTCLADRAMLARCLDGLARRTDGVDLDIVVVLNNLRGADASQARAFLAPWPVTVVHDAAPGFNWSALNNLGARAAAGELLVFVNDDVTPSRPDWLRAMAALGTEPGVGAVGAVLRYPDGRLQHAGVSVERGAPLSCRHLFRDCTGREPRVARWLAHDRTQTAATGACLLTRREVFERAGGFDESLAVAFNDVDYCLRLRHRHGLETAVAAAAELVHHEGASRGDLAELADFGAFCSRWAAALPPTDPYGHPGLARDRDDWMFDAGSAAEAGWWRDCR